MLKKKIFLIITLVFIISLPITSPLKIERINKQVFQEYLLDPPEWASCYFYGFVGLTNQNGQPGIYWGLTAGYCQDDFKGRFAGLITENSEEDPRFFMTGKITGPFLLGIIGNISTEKYTGIVGIGFRNETHFYFRLMGIVGPTFYIAGKYLPIT
jgi:hypothetical protein